MKLKEYDELVDCILKCDGTMSQMIVSYMKDVSSNLALISSVREKSIERHIQAEENLCKDAHAFGHPNYARYLSYQHVMLKSLPQQKPLVWDELLKNGFGGSITGKPFSTEHGDYMIETTINREVKVRGGPMQGGYSTDLTSMNRYVQNTHHLAKLRSAIKKKLNTLTSSVHKEETPSGIRIHEQMIVKMVLQLERYTNPFDDQPARNIKTGEIIDHNVVLGLLNSRKLGAELFQKFIAERIEPAQERVSFFAPIKNPKINTGLTKKKETPKAINVLKEDKQAFGMLVGKTTSLEDALSYPLTTVPLALASPDGDLRQGTKASLRNHLIEDPDLVTHDHPKGKHWIFDGMAVIRAMKPKSNWGTFTESFIKACTPTRESNPISMAIIMDTYDEGRVKEMSKLGK